MKKKINYNAIIKPLTIFLSIFWAFFFTIIFVRYIERKFFYPMKYNDIVSYYSDEYQLEKNLVFAIIKVESNFRKNAESHKGAKGLMQITDTTAQFIASSIKLENYDLKNEDNNINIGCYYIMYLIDKFKNIDTAIIAYNAGEGNVANWLQNKDYSSNGIELKSIPFKESQQYIDKVKKTFKKYENLYRYIVDK